MPSACLWAIPGAAPPARVPVTRIQGAAPSRKKKKEKKETQEERQGGGLGRAVRRTLFFELWYK